jgi:ubiquinone/menaquinone biosynthesis C-methylase UbiE
VSATRRASPADSGPRRGGRYGNPADLARFVRRQLHPQRGAWQKPATVVRALGLQPGQVIAELGPGPGYFTARLARAVGPRERGYAVDPEPTVLEILRARLTRARVRNVTPVLGRAADPLLPAGSCDLALIVNTYHHVDKRPAFLRQVARALAAGGRLVNVDWALRDTPHGPPLAHRVRPEAFLRDARQAGFTLAAEHHFLPYQYFLVLRRAR